MALRMLNSMGNNDDLIALRLRGGALMWVNSRIVDSERRCQTAFRSWQEFRDAFFEATQAYRIEIFSIPSIRCGAETSRAAPVGQKHSLRNNINYKTTLSHYIYKDY